MECFLVSFDLVKVSHRFPEVMRFEPIWLELDSFPELRSRGSQSELAMAHDEMALVHTGVMVGMGKKPPCREQSASQARQPRRHKLGRCGAFELSALSIDAEQARITLLQQYGFACG